VKQTRFYGAMEAAFINHFQKGKHYDANPILTVDLIRASFPS
jgi:hypothetical protein